MQITGSMQDCGMVNNLPMNPAHSPAVDSQGGGRGHAAYANV
jgi:hypothetical protein